MKPTASKSGGRAAVKNATAFATGLVFAIGLGVSGMTRPTKVLGFLDVAGDWDPSLALVMVGAIATHLLLTRWILGRSSPVLEAKFSLPEVRTVDRRLVLGSAIFGLGWGLGGMCPGPALTDLATGAWQPVAFVASMLAGMALFSWVGSGRFGRANRRDRGATPSEKSIHDA